MDWDLVFLIIQCIGAAQGLIWALLLMVNQRITQPEGKLIGAMFAVFSVRVIKSMIYIHTEIHEDWIYNIGFAAHFAIGPLLLFYVHQELFKDGMSKKLLHLLPALLVLLLSPVLTLKNFWYLGGYSILLIQSVLYLIWNSYLVLREGSSSQLRNVVWLWLLITGFGVVLTAYFANYILGLVAYEVAPTVFAGVIVVLSCYLFQFQDIILSGKEKEKYQNINLDKTDIALYIKKIQDHYLYNSPHLNPDYNLSTLAHDVNIQKHILSNVFNQSMGQSFIDFTNQARIDSSKKLLSNSPHLTVAAIAEESGFNSVSSFNKAFKKFTGTTPSKYKIGSK